MSNAQYKAAIAKKTQSILEHMDDLLEEAYPDAMSFEQDRLEEAMGEVFARATRDAIFSTSETFFNECPTVHSLRLEVPMSSHIDRLLASCAKSEQIPDSFPEILLGKLESIDSIPSHIRENIDIGLGGDILFIRRQCLNASELESFAQAAESAMFEALSSMTMTSESTGETVTGPIIKGVAKGLAQGLLNFAATDQFVPSEIPDMEGRLAAASSLAIRDGDVFEPISPDSYIERLREAVRESGFDQRKAALYEKLGIASPDSAPAAPFRPRNR